MASRIRGRARAVAMVASLAVGVGLLQAAPSVAVTASDATVPRAFVSGWIPYWQPATGTAAVTGHASLMDEASPFWLAVDRTGTVVVNGSSSDLAATVTALHAAHVTVLPTVVSTMDADAFAAVLSSATRRAAMVQALARQVQAWDADGLDLDFETVNFGSSGAKDTVRSRYPVLVAELAARLHAAGATLSVTVAARTSDTDPNWWVYDYGRLGAAADRLRLMTYDYSWSGGPAGPIAPVWWVDQVAAYAASRVDPAKVSVGVPAYGRDWFTRTVSGTCPSSARTSVSRTTAQMEAFAAARGITPAWDAASASRTFSYRQRYGSGTTTCVARRTVWYSDAGSLAAELQVVTRRQLRGVAVWALGNEGTGFWARATTYQRNHPVGIPTVGLRAPSSVAFGATAALRVGVTTGAGAVAGTPVTLLSRPSSGGAWTEVDAADTDASGVARFSVAPRRDRDYRAVVPPTWSTTAAQSPVVSTLVTYSVTVDPAVSARLTSLVGRLSGTVGPHPDVVTVVKQVRVAGTWTRVAAQEVAADGRFSFRVVARQPTTKTYRFVVRGAALHPGVSAPVSVTFG